MAHVHVPPGYRSVLSVYETQTAIGSMKRMFEDRLAYALNLRRVSAPLFVEPHTGLNDDLNGFERPVEFDMKEANTKAQIVHSLSKWKRLALHTYGFPIGEGLYTDMNAVRRDEELDNLHSIYVDQWDWEKVIDKSSRTLEYLQQTVTAIVTAICDTADELKAKYTGLDTKLSRNIGFITSQELEDLFPTLSPKEREDAYTKEHGTAFIMQIGGKLRSGKSHDGRAPDYDDWQLNGDILVWYDMLDCAVELSSMGIRVDPATLDSQLRESGCDNRRQLTFHKLLLSGELPLTMGGGIGQSRLSMIMLQKAHIGEVQVSIWDEHTRDMCKSAGILLL